MSQAGGEPDPVALEDEIVRAGLRTESLRKAAGNIVQPPLQVLACLAGLLTPFNLYSLAGWLVVLLCYLLLFLMPDAVAAIYRATRRAQLRRRLARLSADQLTSVLWPLRDGGLEDTARIVLPLLRELRAVPTELIPAAAPKGRGDEVIPPGR